MFVLIFTDGYSIETNEFPTLNDAHHQMETDYNTYMPSEGLNDDCEDLSFCSDTDAALYCNGENVYLWKIVTIQKGD